MKLTILKSDLSAAIRAAGPAVAKSAVSPSLKCFKLFADTANSTLVLSGTDLELGVRAVAPAQVLRDGACFVAADFLANAVKAAPDGDITLDVGKSAELKVVGAKYKVPVEDGASWPDWSRDQSETATVFRVQAVVLCDLMRKAQVAAAQKETETKFLTSGVLLDLKGGTLAAVASDNRRISVASVRHSSDVTCTAVVPRKGVSAILSAFGESGQELLVSVTAGRVKVETDEVQLWSGLMAGRFVPWRDVVERAAKKAKAVRAEFEPANLLGAVRRAALTGDDNDSAILWRFADGKLSLSLTGRAGESEVETEPLSAFETDGEVSLFPNCTTGFLSAAVGAGYSAVEVRTGGPKEGVLFGVSGWQYLEMPRVKE